MTPTDLGYIAGIIDGEGSITLTSPKNHGPNYRLKLRISVGSTSLEMLQYLAHHMGGSASTNKAWKVCLEGCSKSHVHSRKERFTWNITGERAWIVLYNIAPLLICRKEITPYLDEYIPASGYNTGTILRIAKDMKERGWNIECVL